MMNLKTVSIAAVVAVSSTAAWATPVYTGKTTGSGVNVGSQGAGYYLWNDATDTSNWNLRWTGDGVDHSPVSWEGLISFHNNKLETYETYKFENNDGNLDVSNYGEGSIKNDDIYFNALTNNSGGVDGVNFTLDDGYELMDFNLTASFFEVRGDGSKDDADYIFISDLYNTPEVLTTDGTHRTFEVAVPEPGTLALFGVALAGLGLAGRRKA